MEPVIKQYVHIDLILACAHIDMVLGDLRKLFPDSLCTDTHIFRRYCRTDVHLCHLRKPSDKFLRALVNGLCTIKLRIAEIGINTVRSGTDFPPTVLFIDSHRRVKAVLFVRQTNGIGRALHQEIVHVQGGRQSVFSFHIYSSRTRLVSNVF